MAKKKGMDFGALGNLLGKAAGLGAKSISSGDKLGKKTMKKRSF